MRFLISRRIFKSLETYSYREDMNWTCDLSDDTISVFFGPHYKGDYKLLREPFCHKCSSPNTRTDECIWHDDLYGFNRIYAVGVYEKVSTWSENSSENLLSKHIVRLKKWDKYANPLGEALTLIIKNRYKELQNVDAIVPVPAHLEKIQERGYNQSFLLAQIVSSEIGKPIHDVLQQTVNFNLSTSKLNREERRRTVQNSFRFNSNRGISIKNKWLLLIDDIVTSGFTASECAQKLMDNGARQVDVLVAGRTRGDYFA